MALAHYMQAAATHNSMVRVMASSIKDYAAECSEGMMTAALLECFNQNKIKMPPLRKRSGDIAVLLKYFLKHFCVEHNQKEKIFEDEAFEVLVNYDWPGNVKELKNLVE
jgi:DNA-binding NtrC family response regulator